MYIDFKYKFNLREVHKIGILDIRVINCDRNEENILVRKYFLIYKDLLRLREITTRLA